MPAEQMLVCSTVRALAEAISAARPELSPDQKARLELLCSMPRYAEAKDLGTWEETYKEVPYPDTEAELDRLIDAVFEFGEHNLYCAFDPTGTELLYRHLSDRFYRAGIVCPEPGKFTGF